VQWAVIFAAQQTPQPAPAPADSQVALRSELFEEISGGGIVVVNICWRRW
jgi:hypothetical protein